MNKPKNENVKIKYDVSYLFASLAAEIMTDDSTPIEQREDKRYLNLAEDFRKIANQNNE